MKICNVCKTILEDSASYCPRCNNASFSPFKTKRCPFCNSEVAEGTVVCPHCHRILPPEKTERKVESVNQYTARQNAEQRREPAMNIPPVQQTEPIISNSEPYKPIRVPDNSYQTNVDARNSNAYNTLFAGNYMPNSNYDQEESSKLFNPELPKIDERPVVAGRGVYNESIFDKEYKAEAPMSPNIPFNFDSVPKEVPPSNPNFGLNIDNPDLFLKDFSRKDSFAPSTVGKFDDKGRFIPETPKVPTDEEAAANINILTGRASNKPQEKPAKSDGQTIIYNQIYSSMPPQFIQGQGVTPPQPPQTGAVGANTFEGAPTILGVAPKVPDSIDEIKGKPEKAKKSKKEIEPEDDEPYVTPVKVQAALFMVIVLVLGAVAASIMLPYISLRGMEIMGLPLFVVKLPYGLADYFPCYYEDFGILANLGGIEGMIYDYIPYVFDGIMVLSIITVIALLCGFNYKKGVKTVSAIFMVLMLLATVGIGGFMFYEFDFATLGYGILASAACYLVGLILLLFGYKKVRVEKKDDE